MYYIDTLIGRYYCTPKGKRVESLLEKCYLPENEYCLKHLFTWLYNSDEWSKKHAESKDDIPRQRVRYVMNHLCSNLEHRFNPRPFDDFESTNIINHVHFLENTQATVMAGIGELEQDGVHYTKSEFNEIVRFVKNIGTTEGIKQRYRILRKEAYQHDEKVDKMMHCIGLDYKMPYVRNGKLFYKPYRNWYDAPPNERTSTSLIDCGFASGKPEDDGGLYWHLTPKGFKLLEDKLDIKIYHD